MIFRSFLRFLKTKMDGKQREQDRWNELIEIHHQLKDIALRIKELSKEIGRDCSDQKEYLKENVTVHYDSIEDYVSVNMHFHPSLWRDFDVRGELRPGHEPHVDMNFRPPK